MSTIQQLTPGMVVGGDFRVVEPLRAGGMGAVYVAQQVSTGKRRALKVMHKELVEDPKLRERFEQEARVGALISSDHVVEVIGAGVDEPTGMPWIAMELLEGEDLGSRVRARGPFGFSDMKEVFGQLCHALAAAHAAGVVHRDLKPENVFLAKARTARGQSTVKVLDFGIAKLVAQSLATSTATAALGTPTWMAPEQSDPRAQITPATDVWALGLLAYWLYTGRAYWLTAGDPAASMHAIMREILFEPLEVASLRARDQGVAGRLPRGFDEWFARCVARTPKERFASAAEVLEGFERLEPPAGGEAPAPGAGEASAGERANDDVAPMSTRSFLSAPEAPRASGDPAAASSRSSQPDAAMAPTVAVVTPARTSTAPASHAAPLATTEPTVLATGAPPPPAPRADAWKRYGRIALFVAIGLAGANTALEVAKGKLDDVPRPPSVLPSPPSADATATPEAAATSAPGTDAPSPSVDPSASGSARPVVAPAAQRKPAGTATPAAPATAAPAASAAPAPPFDAAGASRMVQQRAGMAKMACRDRPGPRALSASIVFAPEGFVRRIDMDPFARTTQSGFCVAGLLQSARVAPFSGPDQSVPVAVSLD